MEQQINLCSREAESFTGLLQGFGFKSTDSGSVVGDAVEKQLVNHLPAHPTRA